MGYIALQLAFKQISNSNFHNYRIRFAEICNLKILPKIA